MTIDEGKSKCIEALKLTQDHTHSKWVKRPWWKWRLAWGDIDGWGWVKYDIVQIPCSGRLTVVSGIKTEVERTCLDTKIVASALVRCSDPIVPLKSNPELRYAALLLGA
jgi:hypothetical protein